MVVPAVRATTVEGSVENYSAPVQAARALIALGVSHGTVKNTSSRISAACRTGKTSYRRTWEKIMPPPLLQPANPPEAKVRSQDLAGRIFGILTVLYRAKYTGETRWVCRCECGNITQVASQRLLRGEIISCGQHSPQLHGTHGQTGTRLYQQWLNLRTWCMDKNNEKYVLYGAHDITLTDGFEDFATFAAWSQTHGWTENSTLVRLNKDKNFTPDNCRWETPFSGRAYKNPSRWRPITQVDGRGIETQFRSIADAATALLSTGEGNPNGNLQYTVSGIQTAAKTGGTYHKYRWVYTDS